MFLHGSIDCVTQCKTLHILSHHLGSCAEEWDARLEFRQITRRQLFLTTCRDYDYGKALNISLYNFLSRTTPSVLRFAYSKIIMI